MDLGQWFSFDDPSFRPTCCLIICFLPIKNNEWGASFHGYNSEVGRGCSWRVGDILFSSLLLREVTQRGGDGAGFIWLLIRLIDHMWSWKTTTHWWLNSLKLKFASLRALGKHSYSSKESSLTDVTFFSHGINFRSRNRAEYWGVLPCFKSGC